jgi:hypothetical protein
MMLGRFFRVVFGLQMMAVCHVCMVAGLFRLTRFVVFRGDPVVPGRFFMLVRCLAVMFCAWMGHVPFPFDQ